MDIALALIAAGQLLCLASAAVTIWWVWRAGTAVEMLPRIAALEQTVSSLADGYEKLDARGRQRASREARAESAARADNAGADAPGAAAANGARSLTQDERRKKLRMRIAASRLSQ